MMWIRQKDESDRTEAWLEQLGCMTLYPRPESVSCARRWFRDLTMARQLVCSVDDCLLLLSELVTNAIVHGGTDGDWRVRVEWWRDGNALRVDVHDPGPLGSVVLRQPSEDDVCGRGLHLVAALADRWEVGPSRFSGTRVSFVMDNAWKSEEDL